MLVSNKKMQDVEAFMQKLDSDMKARNVSDQRMARLRNELRIMSRDRMSIERSKDQRKIALFNNQFVSKLAELSKLVQTHGFTNRDEVATIVRKVKAQ